MESLYKELAGDLIKKIASGVYPIGTKLPTEDQLAHLHHVSRVTVRAALKILAQKKLIYRVAGSGTFVGDVSVAKGFYGGKAIIGVILCNFSAAYGTELLKSLEKNISSFGYTLALMNSHYSRELESKAIRELVQASASGIIIQPVHNETHNPELMRLSLSDYPFVLLDRNLQGLSLPFVGSDNKGAVVKAMRYIFDCGHEKICMFAPVPTDTLAIEERIDAFEKSFVSEGGKKHKYLFTGIESPLVETPPLSLIDKDVAAIEEYLKRFPEITCAFASEYAVARLVRKAARNLHIGIPEGLSLITFDNHNDPFRPNSTTFIRQKENEIAGKAFDIMLQLLNGKKDNGRYYIDVELVDNGSVISPSAARNPNK